MGVVMELLKKVTQHKCQSSHYQVVQDEGSPRVYWAPEGQPRRHSSVPQAPAPHPGAPAGPAAGTMRPALAAARPRRGAQSVAALGWVMSAGTTQASNSSAVTKPSSRADSRSDSPLWWAFLAILEALS